MEKKEAKKRRKTLESEASEPLPKKKRYASRSTDPTKALSNLEHAKLQKRLQNRQWYGSLPKEKKDALLLRRREAYARKKLQKEESPTNLTSSFNTSQQTEATGTLLRMGINDIPKNIRAQMEKRVYHTYEIGSTSRQPSEFDEDASSSVYLENTSRLNCRERVAHGFEISIPFQPSILEQKPDCSYCGAKKFAYEPKGFCCSTGQVLVASNFVPEELMNLFTSNNEEAIHFKTHVRTYNNTFAFTSFGVKCEKELCKRNKGIYTFKVQGQVYHYINELLPPDGHPSYLQLYFYDTDHEVENRMYQSPKLRPDILQKLMDILTINPYCEFFRSLRYLSISDDTRIFIRCDPQLDQRVYNAPSSSQVAGIWTENSNANQSTERDIIIYSHAGNSHRIKHYFGCYDPLEYPLLFPYGDAGWHRCIKRKQTNALLSQPNILSVDDLLKKEKQAAKEKSSSKENISCREYYCYKLQIRPSESSILLHSGRLLQQYVVDMYIKLETSRLDYFRNDQHSIRADLYQGIMDSIGIGETSGKKIGKRIVLPPSFIGGPRNMRRRYLDAMALVQKFGKPDIFLTITCNPAWLEIKDQLGHGEEAQNRPDLVARVFRAKIEELKLDLMKKNIFGAVAAHVYVIEFQKRGLPHAHFLLILKHRYKLKTPEMYDKFVSAELPNNKSYPHLYKMVVQHMMHGPCGNLNPNNVCMRNGQCKNHYPREFCSITTQTKNSYPLYKRQNTGEEVKVRGCFLDNRWVVPYNPYLLAKFNCHMNVEVCSTVKAVKYLYKYIYKGHDRIMFHLGGNTAPEDIDEIQQFQQARWISPPEAMWRIYQFCLNEIYPSVKSLQVHLENMQTVGFREDTNLLSILHNQEASKTMLTEYFRMNQIDKDACRLLYKEFPESYVWNEDKKYWSKRKQRIAIGRLVAASPVEGERYYLRLLLNHVKGATSYQNLRTINEIKFGTFREAAEQLGLLESDNNIDQCLEEASLFQMPFTLRRLFATLLVYCGVHNPAKLWDKYKDAMSEDFQKTNLMSTSTIEAKALQSISFFLESMGKSITEYTLPAIMTIDSPDERLLKEIHEELNIPISENELFTIHNLNTEQKSAYSIILERIRSGGNGVFFIDGPGGTGKTYLYRALLITLRSEGHVALATATSGIAASILPGGRTAHSRFKLPLNFEDRSTCNISKQSGLAELLRRAKLIIWDEASMANRRAIEALNVMLQDITDCKLLFGGKVIVFGGDFRQIPPVIIRGGKKETIDASLVMSELWSKIQKIKLTENMRAKIDPRFSEFLLRVGNGTEIAISEERIQIPKTMIIPYTDDISSKFELINCVFPNLMINGYDAHFMTNRAILTTKNEFVDELNQLLIEEFPGDSIKYYSFDSTIDEAQQNIPEEFLNGLTPNGLPPHELILKKNCPVILLRNIDPSSGLCNGTRLICRNFQKNVIDAEIVVGHHEGKRVFLPRIPLQSDQDEKFPLPFKRKQFPIRLSFAMTINKAQGQTLENVGIYLPQPVFSHGQLYVALSRVRSGEAIKILLNPSSKNNDERLYTRNVVYRDLLALASNNK